MVKYYSFAGIDIAVSVPDEWMYDDDRMLSNFRTDDVTKPHVFSFSMVDEFPAPSGRFVAKEDNFVVYWNGDTRCRYVGAKQGDWTKAYMLASHSGREHYIQLKKSVYKQGVSPKAVLNAMEAEHLAVDNGGFVFHSSFVEVNGKAILFTAPSGTGKSTQAELWRLHRDSRIINGDRSVVRLKGAEVSACGIPFMGSSNYCENIELPLSGIVYLSQAKQTSIRRLSGLEAFGRVWEGISVNTWDKSDVEKVMDTVMQVISSVPVWYLECTPDVSAVIALEEQLESR